jgi:hypothetical protein
VSFDAAAAPVKIPADIQIEDRLLGDLTARQVAILACTGLSLWGICTLVHTALPGLSVIALAAAALPLAAIAGTLALASRDGVSADRYLVAMIRHHRAPKRLVTAPGTIHPAPSFLAELAGENEPLPDRFEHPVQHVTDAGLLDLGSEGTAGVAACTSVNFALRTGAEQEALVAGFARYLNALTGPVQILVRTRRLELGPLIGQLLEAGPSMPHPALQAAAEDHAHFLAQLARTRSLLYRQALLAVREPAPPTTAGPRVRRRLAEATGLLAGAQITVRELDAGTVAEVLRDAADPEDIPTDQTEEAWL